jgi:hypothetical protein
LICCRYRSPSPMDSISLSHARRSSISSITTQTKSTLFQGDTHA